MKQLFIFEGPDGCGKSTQVQLLEQKLTSLGKKVKVTREPGGTPLGEKIREILLNDENIIISKETEAYLFAASRRAHNEQIKEWIGEGYVVLCDRHLLSSLIFQATRSFKSSEVKRLNDLAMEPLLSHDCYSSIISNSELLYFDINIETYKKRNEKRIADRGLDKVESRYTDTGSISKLLKDYRSLAEHQGANIIDANRKIADIHQEVIDIL